VHNRPSEKSIHLSNFTGWDKMSSNGVTEDDDFADYPFREYNSNAMLS